MSYERDIRRKISINITGKEEQIEKLHEALVGEFGSCECELEKKTSEDPCECEITLVETGTETVYPGCMYMNNGDPGYPDEYEDTLELYDGAVEEFIAEYMDDNDVEFDYTVTLYDDELI